MVLLNSGGSEIQPNNECHRGQRVIPILCRDTNSPTEATWIKHWMFSMNLWDVRCACLTQSTTKNDASGSVVALPAYTHTNVHSHTWTTVLLAPYLGWSQFGSHEIDVRFGEREQRQTPFEFSHILNQWWLKQHNKDSLFLKKMIVLGENHHNEHSVWKLGEYNLIKWSNYCFYCHSNLLITFLYFVKCSVFQW